jgi:hypothetical protein
MGFSFVLDYLEQIASKNREPRHIPPAARKNLPF